MQPVPLSVRSHYTGTLAANVKLRLSVSIELSASENLPWECNIIFKDCRLGTLKTIPSVASHLPEFYFWCTMKKLHVPADFTLSLSCAWQGEKYLRWAAKKCSRGVHEGVLSVQIQHSISITRSVCYWFTVCPMLSVGQTQQISGFESCQSR